MSNQSDLESLKLEMAADKILPLKTNLVFGEGNPDAEVLFIGEAPGAEEDKLIRPFVGRSGQLLRKNIRDIGWKEENVYITNIVKRRPPENRDPTEEEIEKYKPYLARQIEIINPKIIVTLGRFSMNYFLPLAKITRDQGKLFPLPAPDCEQPACAEHADRRSGRPQNDASWQAGLGRRFIYPCFIQPPRFVVMR